MMTPLELLIATRDYLTDPEHCYCYPDNIDGRFHKASNPDCVCIAGALRLLMYGKVTPCNDINAEDRVIRAAERILAGYDPAAEGNYMTAAVANFNDTHSHAEILKYLDEGIERAQNG